MSSETSEVDLSGASPGAVSLTHAQAFSDLIVQHLHHVMVSTRTTYTFWLLLLMLQLQLLRPELRWVQLSLFILVSDITLVGVVILTMPWLIQP